MNKPYPRTWIVAGVPAAWSENMLETTLSTELLFKDITCISKKRQEKELFNGHWKPPMIRLRIIMKSILITFVWWRMFQQLDLSATSTLLGAGTKMLAASLIDRPGWMHLCARRQVKTVLRKVFFPLNWINPKMANTKMKLWMGQKDSPKRTRRKRVRRNEIGKRSKSLFRRQRTWKLFPTRAKAIVFSMLLRKVSTSS